MSFNSKVVLITGGSSGIGRASALDFANKGAKVVVSSRREKEGEETVSMVKKAGGTATYVKGDVESKDDIINMIHQTVATYGGLDIAFNNAGIEGVSFVPCADYPEEIWDKVININLKGVYLSMKYQIPEMLKKGGGAIVNMASVAGLRGGMVGVGYYASKHGVIGITKAAAFEYAKQGIRINAVCPAVIDTDMADRLFYQDDEVKTMVTDLHHIGRTGKPMEVAKAVSFLCSDDASFMTGLAVPVDGGFLL